MNYSNMSRDQLLQEVEKFKGKVVELKEANQRLDRDLEGWKRLNADALQESQERFQRLLERASDTFFEAWSRRLVDSASDAFLIVERDGKIVNVNRAACDYLGYTHEELLGLSMPDILKAQDVQKFSEMWDQLIPGSTPVTVEETYVRRDGSALPVEVRGSLVELAGRQHMIALARDVTDRKRTEQQTIRLERMRALGEMAEGVSHNLNNILFGVLAPAQFLQRTSSDPDVLHRVGQIITSTGRAVDLLQRFHYALRGGDDNELTSVSANEEISQAIRATQPRWKDEPEAKGYTIEVLTDLENVPPIAGTRAGLQKAVINLILNAADAMPNGGRITVRTRSARGGVRISVSDSGSGLSENERQRAFEPYFNLNDEVGVGLGLFTVYSTVTRWGGTVDVDSVQDKGSTFTIRLPEFEGHELEMTSPTQGAAAIATRRGRVIVVENEDIIRRLMYELLSGSHDVQTFANGHDALEHFIPGNWDVAIIDLGMPGIPGDQIAERIKALDNSVTTVLVTGWRLPQNDYRLSAFDFRLQKPVNLDEVESIVSRAIQLHDTKA